MSTSKKSYDWKKDPTYREMKDYFFGSKDKKADWKFSEKYIEGTDGEPSEG